MRVGLRGTGPALAGNVGAGWAFALSREGGQGVDVPMLAPARSRSAWRIWVGSAGSVLRSQGTLGQTGISRCRARGIRVSTFLCSLRPDPAPPGVFVGSAGPVLRSQGTWGQTGLSRCRARGIRVSTFQCSLRPDPAPPGVFVVAECRGWRLGLVGGGGSAGSVLRSQGTWGQAGLSRCRARGIRVSTFLCSLRPGPAAASVCVGWVVARCRCLGGGQSACDLLVVGALDAVVGDGPIPVGHGLFLNRQIEKGGPNSIGVTCFEPGKSSSGLGG